MPGSLAELVALKGDSPAKAENDRLVAEFLVLVSQDATDRPRLYQQWLTRQPAEMYRQADLVGRAGHFNASRATQQANDALQEASVNWAQFCVDTNRQHPYCNIDTLLSDFTCGQHLQLFNAWKFRAHAYVDALVDYYKTVWPVWTGIQGSLHDPLAHRIAGTANRLVVNSAIRRLTGAIVDDALAFDAMNRRAKDLAPGATCTNPEPPEPEDSKTKETGTPAEACDDSMKPWGVEIDVKVLDIKLTCDTLSVEASTALPLLQGFAKIELGATPQGFVKSSVFVGVKLTDGAISSFESAFYTSYDPTSRIKDIGWVVGPEIEPTVGPVKLKVWEGKIKFSLITIQEDPW